ncbi:MAG: glutamate--tRNA ligase [Desulfobacteraceae bacterium]|jgi:glutamyl-tRNA synthetase|nr:glutamate--tRNA ligase [Desulfobacteraceae bacterium]
MEKIITRFPPSPTGYLHVGGARTALFNWLYARNMNGRFILRIEDTDTERSTQESVDAIFESLEWLGIDYDEGPYFQSRRFDIYKEYIQKLVDSDHAYFCTCSPEDVDAMRKEAMAAGRNPKYNGKCRDKNLPPSNNSVIRFKAPKTGTTIVEDVVKGNIVFQNNELDDFIIQRSDGTSTYNLAVVVDDITMNINTILRGDDHVNNTPKQIILYKAFGSPLPVFGHLPMVLGSDKKRLSKRHGAMSVTEYRDMGYLPDALLNYLVRLGWSYGDQEFFTKNELIEKFTIKNIGKSSGVFDKDKLLALNSEHIKQTSLSNMSRYLLPLLKEKGCAAEEGEFIEKVISTLNTRSKTIPEMAEGALFYYNETIIYDEKAAKKNLKPSYVETLKILVKEIESLDPFNEQNLENAFKSVMEKLDLKFGKIAQPVRVALTGSNVSPGIFEIIDVLGKEKTITRINDAIKFIHEKKTD